MGAHFLVQVKFVICGAWMLCCYRGTNKYSQEIKALATKFTSSFFKWKFKAIMTTPIEIAISAHVIVIWCVLHILESHYIFCRIWRSNLESIMPVKCSQHLSVICLTCGHMMSSWLGSSAVDHVVVSRVNYNVMHERMKCCRPYTDWAFKY